MIPISTDRLILRQWREEDRQAFFEMNADPEIMRFFDDTRSRAEADAPFDRLLRDIDCDEPFAPAIEIGWRRSFPSP